MYAKSQLYRDKQDERSNEIIDRQPVISVDLGNGAVGTSLLLLMCQAVPKAGGGPQKTHRLREEASSPAETSARVEFRDETCAGSSGRRLVTADEHPWTVAARWLEENFS